MVEPACRRALGGAAGINALTGVMTPAAKARLRTVVLSEAQTRQFERRRAEEGIGLIVLKKSSVDRCGCRQISSKAGLPEAAIATFRFAKGRYVRLDPMAMDQPSRHVC